MARTHNLGFPRIGAERELKFALEKYWRGETSLDDLEAEAAKLRKDAWLRQASLDWSPTGDFSLYDHVLDMSFLLGNVPARASADRPSSGDAYFRMARGRAPGETREGIRAGEMTKWFDTNYHYIVPELSQETRFDLDARKLLRDFQEARELGVRAKPVILGPVSYLRLSKATGGQSKLSFLPDLLAVYRRLLGSLSASGAEWVQIDEPALVTSLEPEWKNAYRYAYEALAEAGPKLLLATYFGGLRENLELAVHLPVQGVHLDAVSAPDEAKVAHNLLPQGHVLSLGVVSGRNIWRADLDAILDRIEPIHEQRGDQLWLGPSCSLLHVPVDLGRETKIDRELRSWLAFATQKIDELSILRSALCAGRGSVQSELAEAADAQRSRRTSPRVHNLEVKRALASLDPSLCQRRSPYPERREIQRSILKLPAFPTTTIGSFPQTAEIRKARSDARTGRIEASKYTEKMHKEIARAIAEQESLGLDVLVHGEAERNDMVEYFGEQLEGYAFSEFGWVQSYGSRCVKPPILFGDVSRPKPMTVEWTKYAQSLSEKPVKGMLTGPVTILNWSFVRDDQPRRITCFQLALAIRKEVQDLEKNGVRIVQIDEAALREGLPLRKSEWNDYLGWAVDAFRIASSGVSDETQIHTHMCYSEFNDIIASIAAMDADVITIETSRSNMELLEAFDSFDYPNEIGPGVYDIHSPNIPTVEQIMELMNKATARIAPDRLWVNPDCGLKTRAWPEVIPALRNMVLAAERLRASM